MVRRLTPRASAASRLEYSSRGTAFCCVMRAGYAGCAPGEPRRGGTFLERAMLGFEVRLVAGPCLEELPRMASRIRVPEDSKECRILARFFVERHHVHGIRSLGTFVVKRFENSRSISPPIRPARPTAALVKTRLAPRFALG